MKEFFRNLWWHNAPRHFWEKYGGHICMWLLGGVAAILVFAYAAEKSAQQTEARCFTECEKICSTYCD